VEDKNCVFVSSDLPSLHGFAEYGYILEDKTIAIVSLEGLQVFDIETESLVDLGSMQLKRVKPVVEYVEKAGLSTLHDQRDT